MGWLCGLEEIIDFLLGIPSTKLEFLLAFECTSLVDLHRPAEMYRLIARLHMFVHEPVMNHRIENKLLAVYGRNQLNPLQVNCRPMRRNVQNWPGTYVWIH